MDGEVDTFFRPLNILLGFNLLDDLEAASFSWLWASHHLQDKDST